MSGPIARGRRVAGSARRLTAVLCFMLVGVQTGCHTYLPVTAAVPDRGESVGVRLNDQGRALLSGRLGELVERVDGELIAESDSAITLNVSRTRSLRGGHSVWAGEPVEIPRAGIMGFQKREFSRGRTLLMTIALVVGVVAIGSAIGLDVIGLGRGDKGSGNPTNEQ